MSATDIATDIATRFARLDRYIEEGKLLRVAWHDGPKGPDGYERACLLMAIAPEVNGGDPSADRCPAWLLPRWLAHLTPWLDDAGSDGAWPEQVRRYSRAVRLVPMLDEAAQNRLHYAVRAAILRCVLDHAGDSRPAVETVLALCERAARGEPVGEREWARAWSAARSAAWAAWATAEAAEAAAAAWTAEAAAAAEAAEAAEAAAWASSAAEAAEGREDVIVDAILTAIEQAVGVRS